MEGRPFLEFLLCTHKIYHKTLHGSVRYKKSETFYMKIRKFFRYAVNAIRRGKKKRNLNEWPLKIYRPILMPKPVSNAQVMIWFSPHCHGKVSETYVFLFDSVSLYLHSRYPQIEFMRKICFFFSLFTWIFTKKVHIIMRNQSQNAWNLIWSVWVKNWNFNSMVKHQTCYGIENIFIHSIRQ